MGVVALTVAAVAVFAHVHRWTVRASFLSQGIAFAVAFTDAAEGWLASGETEAIEKAARLMFLGSVLYVRVSSHGVVQVDVQRETLPTLDIPTPSALSRIPQAEYMSVADAGIALDVVVPLFGGGSGYVRVGLDTGEVVRSVRHSVLVATGIGVGFDFALLSLLFWVTRRRSRRAGLAPEEWAWPQAMRVGELQLDESGKAVSLAGVPLALSPKLYTLLSLLSSEPGRVFSDREILAAVWPDSRYANAKDVKQHIYLLRKKLRGVKPGAEEMIVNVPGFGYRLDPFGEVD